MTVVLVVLADAGDAETSTASPPAANPLRLVSDPSILSRFPSVDALIDVHPAAFLLSRAHEPQAEEEEGEEEEQEGRAAEEESSEREREEEVAQLSSITSKSVARGLRARRGFRRVVVVVVPRSPQNRTSPFSSHKNSPPTNQPTNGSQRSRSGPEGAVILLANELVGAHPTRRRTCSAGLSQRLYQPITSLHAEPKVIR